MVTVGSSKYNSSGVVKLWRKELYFFSQMNIGVVVSAH
jgi:hypothetical protein